MRSRERGHVRCAKKKSSSFFAEAQLGPQVTSFLQERGHVRCAKKEEEGFNKGRGSRDKGLNR